MVQAHAGLTVIMVQAHAGLTGPYPSDIVGRRKENGFGKNLRYKKMSSVGVINIKVNGTKILQSLV